MQNNGKFQTAHYGKTQYNQLPTASPEQQNIPIYPQDITLNEDNSFYSTIQNLNQDSAHAHQSQKPFANVQNCNSQITPPEQNLDNLSTQTQEDQHFQENQMFEKNHSQQFHNSQNQQFEKHQQNNFQNPFQSLFGSNNPLSNLLGSNLLSSILPKNSPLTALLSGNLNQNQLFETLSSLLSSNKKNTSSKKEEASVIEIENSFEEM